MYLVIFWFFYHIIKVYKKRDIPIPALIVYIKLFCVLHYVAEQACFTCGFYCYFSDSERWLISFKLSENCIYLINWAKSSVVNLLCFDFRCIGILLQKVNDRAYVRDKIDWMYEQADISIPANRLGLAKAMGLVFWVYLPFFSLRCWFSAYVNMLTYCVGRGFSLGHCTGKAENHRG